MHEEYRVPSVMNGMQASDDGQVDSMVLGKFGIAERDRQGETRLKRESWMASESTA